MNPDEEHRQPGQSSGKVPQDVARPGAGLVVSYVHHHVDAEARLSGDGLIESRVQNHDGLFEVGPLAARPKPDSRFELIGSRHPGDVDAEVDPYPWEAVLDRLGDSRLACPRGPLKITIWPETAMFQV
jgi:hypothetical protein